MDISILNNLTYVQIAFASLILLITFLLRPKKRLNEPPLVPYKYPLIGHTIEYRRNSEKLIKECQEKYGEIFSLYVYGRVITYIGKELVSEIFRNHKDFNFNEAADEIFPSSGFLNRKFSFFNVLIKVVQANLSGDLKSYTERVQKHLIKSIDQVIGNYKVMKPPISSTQIIIARPIAATLVGEELAEDEELIKTFAFITSDLGQFLSGVSGTPYLSFIHPALHRKYVVLSFRLLNNPFKVHKDLLKKKITPLIKERLSEMKKLGDNYIPPTDILQRFIERLMNKDDYTVEVDDIADQLLLTIFASVHTTSTFLTFCLQEWVNNPQFHREILEEQEQLYNNNKDAYYSNETVAKMEKLDSFIKETLRLNSGDTTLQHKTVSSHFTFSNGYQVPKGRFVTVRVGEIYYDEKIQGQNPKEFDAFRYVNKKSPASRVDRNYLPFGLGKHACPGRYFAINEIKVALHFILLNYNIRKETNEKIKPFFHEVTKIPSSEGLILEKKNVKY